MSRIIVKNLPKTITSEKLKKVFSENAVVTDVQLKYTKEGTFRGFGFVGFKNEDEGKAAILQFNKSYIDGCKISVEESSVLGEAPKSWAEKLKSKKAKDDAQPSEEIVAAKSKKEKKKEKKEKSGVEIEIEKRKDDKLFKEFMSNHLGSSNQAKSLEKLLSTEDEKSGSDDSEEEIEEEEEKETVNIAKEKISDADYMKLLKSEKPVEKIEAQKAQKKGTVKLFEVKVHGLAYSHKKKHVKAFFQPLTAKSIRVPRKIHGIAFVGFKTEKQRKQALAKDRSFLEGKQLFVTKYENREKEPEKTDEKKVNPKWKQQEEALKDEESVAESGRIFFRNLAYSVVEDDITKLFEKYGPLSQVEIPIDKDTRKSKGFGTVSFVMPEHAVKAYSELDGTVFHGRMLHLLPAKTQITEADLLEQDGLSYKQKKELKMKATAGSSHNWNSLFLGHDAVAETIAAKYNMSKEQVLDDNGIGSVAVRLALGETQVVQETQKFLEENGVHLDAFKQSSTTRSKTAILIKNLPAGTKSEEITDMFAKHGEIARALMPPLGITALVEFFEPSEARKAFKKLAYTKFKSLPLYLEWAPENTFMAPAQRKVKVEIEDESVKKESVGDSKGKNEGESEEEDDLPEDDTTLFVKNLDFSTTQEELSKLFEKCGKLHYVNLPTIIDKNNGNKKRPAGYGFVRFKLKSNADRALKELQFTSFKGKTLELKRSERTLASDVTTARKKANVTKQTGSTILVRNIPFQATGKEIEQLFKAFGELKAVRLPKKLMEIGKHKGFGFVEFHSKTEAKKAFKALCQSSHLYGRRLVLEWAQTEENVEEIRKRAVKNFDNGESGSKKFKKSVLDVESMEGVDLKNGE